MHTGRGTGQGVNEGESFLSPRGKATCLQRPTGFTGQEGHVLGLRSCPWPPPQLCKRRGDATCAGEAVVARWPRAGQSRCHRLVSGFPVSPGLSLLQGVVNARAHGGKGAGRGGEEEGSTAHRPSGDTEPEPRQSSVPRTL